MSTLVTYLETATNQRLKNRDRRGAGCVMRRTLARRGLRILWSFRCGSAREAEHTPSVNSLPQVDFNEADYRHARSEVAKILLEKTLERLRARARKASFLWVSDLIKRREESTRQRRLAGLARRRANRENAKEFEGEIPLKVLAQYLVCDLKLVGCSVECARRKFGKKEVSCGCSSLFSGPNRRPWSERHAWDEPERCVMPRENWIAPALTTDDSHRAFKIEKEWKRQGTSLVKYNERLAKVKERIEACSQWGYTCAEDVCWDEAESKRGPKKKAKGKARKKKG